MSFPLFRPVALAALALALGLSGCGGKDAAAPATAIADTPAPAGKAWSDVVTVTPEGGYRMGNPAAPIKLVEYGSLTCPHCADFAKESAEEIAGKFVASGRVSYEFRNFVRDAVDLTAATLTHCGGPETFFPLTKEVYAHQSEMFDKLKASGDQAYTQAMNLPENQRFVVLARLTGMDAFFAARGLPAPRVAACLSDPRTPDTLAKATEAQGKQFDIDSTPTIFINGDKVESVAWPDVRARLIALGAR